MTDEGFLVHAEVTGLFDKYMEEIPRRRLRPGSNFIFSASGATAYKIDEAIDLISIKTGLTKYEIIQILMKEDYRQVQNMSGYSYTYYKASSDLEQDA